MGNLKEITGNLYETQAVIRKTKELLSQYPGDSGLLTSLQFLIKRESDLEDDFLFATDREHLDVCTYRLFSQADTPLPVSTLGNSLSTFQKWFSAVYDGLKYGPKKRARLTPDVLNESTLHYAFSFLGSVGVVLTIPSERMLIDSFLQRAMDKTVDMVKSESSDQVHFFAKELGSASIRALYRWVNDNVLSGTGVDLKWLRKDKERKAIIIKYSHFQNLEKAIEETSDKEERVFDIRGVLVGADTQNHTFHMAFEKHNEIRGTMSEEIGEDYIVELPQNYFAKIRKCSFINYATEEESIKYHLLSLKKI